MVVDHFGMDVPSVMAVWVPGDMFVEIFYGLCLLFLRRGGGHGCSFELKFSIEMLIGGQPRVDS